MRKINVKSDFDLFLTLKDCKGDDIGFPPYDWAAIFWAGTRDFIYEASCIGGVCTNCYNDNGRIHIIAKSHSLGIGILNVEFRAKLPRDIYPDGYQRNVMPEPLDIELVVGKGDLPSEMEVELLLPYIKGDKGDKLTYSDLTDLDKADLISPIKNDIAKKADRSELSNIVGVPTEEKIGAIDPTLVTEALRKVPQVLTPEEQAQVKANLAISKMELFDDMWRAAVGVWGDIDHDHYEDGVNKPYCLNKLWLTSEEAVEIYCAPRISSTGAAGLFFRYPYKTNLPPQGYGGAGGSYQPIYTLDCLLSFGTNDIPVLPLEVLNLFLPFGMRISNPSHAIINIKGLVAKYSKLRKIIGDLWINNISNVPQFLIAPNLEEVSLCGLLYNCDLSECPKLNIQSFQTLVKNKYATHPGNPTVTVHPSVYSKLTDETNTEWHQVLLDAAEKNITFATT